MVPLWGLVVGRGQKMADVSPRIFEERVVDIQLRLVLDAVCPASYGDIDREDP